MALVFKSSMDDSAFAAGLRKMEVGAMKAATSIGGALNSLGAAGVGGSIVAAWGGAAVATNTLINSLSALHDEAAAIGVSAEEFQRLSFVFTQAGASSSDAMRGVGNLTRALVDARDPASKQAEAMATLGLSLAEVNEADPSAALQAMASAYKDAEDKGAAFAAISEMIGSKLAVKLLPALSEGGEAMRRIAGEAKIINEELVNQAEAIGDVASAWTRNLGAGIIVEGAGIGKQFFEAFRGGLFASPGASIGQVLIQKMVGIGIGAPDSGAKATGDSEENKRKAATARAIEAEKEKREIEVRNKEMQKIGEDALKSGDALAKSIKADRIARERAQEDEETEAFKKDAKDRAEASKFEGEVRLGMLEAVWAKQKQVAADALAARQQALGDFANQMGEAGAAGEDLRAAGIAREQMTPAQRRAADNAAKMQKKAEEKFDRKNPDIARAIEQAKAMEAKARKDMSVKLSDGQIKQIVDGFKDANEALISK